MCQVVRGKVDVMVRAVDIVRAGVWGRELCPLVKLWGWPLVLAVCLFAVCILSHYVYVLLLLGS